MHEEALTKEATALLPLFRRFEGYYLVGGTALALQIGHRISVDFDFFSSKELPPHLLQRVKRVFSEYPIVVTYAAYEQLNLVINGVKATFFYYEYPVQERFNIYKGIPLASVPEIAAMKAFSIGKRIAYKDYVDWYFLLHEGRGDITHIIALAQKKYGNDFNDRLFLGQLASLKDVPTQKIDFLKDEVKRETIENFLKKTVKEYMH
ncbi:MAG: hypothetical protein G01um101433_265 [Parcubacteria group bacterium Gr01-1014_33]|nr:MAG: hypothetical protein G01um101433_265 [Parcubacteria group bacterium Gr01-1014_33]